jgi:ABC-type transport system involved in cytochrome c biogenesis permease subunit
VQSAAPAAALIAPGAIDREITYNSVRPSRLAWWILLPATIAAIFAWSRSRRWLDALAIVGLVLGFAVMTWGLAVRWQVAERIPASNMYESLLFLAWGVGLFAVGALLFLRNRLIVLNATAMSALTMMLADILPIDPFIHPMPPVLSGTAWLAIHVPIIMVSYSILALGVVVAHMQIGVEIFAPKNRELSFRMNDLLYWYMHAGAILLIAGILTGSIWAASSWGRYWGWDPKEVWSLIAFLAYLAILHGRFDRWLGSFGVAALSIVAFWTLHRRQLRAGRRSPFVRLRRRQRGALDDGGGGAGRAVPRGRLSRQFDHPAAPGGSFHLASISHQTSAATAHRAALMSVLGAQTPSADVRPARKNFAHDRGRPGRHRRLLSLFRPVAGAQEPVRDCR